MPITLELVENGHIFHYVYTDPWTVQQLIGLTPQLLDYYNKSPHKIHTLSDTTRIRQVPPDVMRVQCVPNLSHPQSGNIAIFGATMLIETLSTTIFRLARFNRVKFYAREEDAWAYLRAIIAEES